MKTTAQLAQEQYATTVADTVSVREEASEVYGLQDQSNKLKKSSEMLIGDHE